MNETPVEVVHELEGRGGGQGFQDEVEAAVDDVDARYPASDEEEVVEEQVVYREGELEADDIDSNFDRFVASSHEKEGEEECDDDTGEDDWTPVLNNREDRCCCCWCCCC